MSHKKLTLGEVAHCQTGPFGSQLHEKDYVVVGTPIVTVEHLGEIGFSHQNLPFVSDQDKARLFKYTLKLGDIVFSRVGSVDRCTYVTKYEDGWMFSGRCIRVRCKKTVSSKYLSFYFRLKPFKQMMRNIAVGATMPSLNTSLMDSLILFLPQLNSQNKIAGILEALDSKIEINNKINDELEAMAKLIYDYWFVQFDFPDANGKPYKSSGGKMIYSEELKREIPKEWTSDRIGNLLTKETQTKKLPKTLYQNEGNIPIIDQSSKFICGYTNDKDTLITSEIPRIVFGDHTRVLKLVNFDFAKGADGTQVFLSNTTRVPQHFFYLSLVKIDLSNYGYARHFKFLKQTQTIIPNQKVVLQFEDIVRNFYLQVRHNILETKKLEELRDWLLPMLMNGQVTVGENS